MIIFIILLSFENYEKAINDFSTTISNKIPLNWITVSEQKLLFVAIIKLRLLQSCLYPHKNTKLSDRVMSRCFY